MMNSLVLVPRMGLKMHASLAGHFASAFSALAVEKDRFIALHRRTKKALAISLLAGAPLVSFGTVTRDANGWTQITPSSDSRVVYVSNAGSDSNNGLSASTPKATIAAANSLIRDGYPDHLLLRRGDTFTLSGGLGSWKNGRNANEPIVFSYYGASGARPVVKVTSEFINHNGAVRNYQVFKGIDIYKSNSDPSSSDYTGVSSSTAVRFVGGGANLRIEDCRFRFIETVIQSYSPGTYTNVEVRRNIIVDAWKQDSFTVDAKIMGMYVSGVNGYLIEENFFDHNGWSEVVANAGANQYNHNVYIQYDNAQGGIIRGNIFTRGAAHGLQARSGGEIDRNLFSLNAVGFNIGGVAEPTDPDVETWPNYAHDNVVLNGRLMSTVNSDWPRTNAVWGVWEDSYIQGASVDGNIVANRINSGANSSYNGIENMDFGTNISYNWDPSLDTTNGSWPHPNDDLGDYNASIGGSNSTTSYLTTLRNRAPGDLPWNLTAYAAINYIRAGFLMSPVSGVYNYPGGGGSGSGVTAIAGAGFQNTAITSQTGTFTVTFSATPSVSPINSVVGLAPGAPSGYGDLATIARFNPSGFIDARNGANYSAASSIAYSGGQTYAFRLVINVPAKTYSIYVTPPGGSEQTVGSNYGFRSEQSSATSLDYWSAETDATAPSGSSVNVNNFAIQAGGGGGGNLLSFGTFEPSQSTVLQDMPTTYTLGSGATNIWFGYVGTASGQRTTYQTSGSNHYVTVGTSVNTNGCMQVVAWPGAGTHQVSFSYRGAGAFVRIYGGNTGNTIDKFSGINTLTLLQTISPSSASSWTTATQNVSLSGSYNYLVIALRGGDFDSVTVAP